ncbi:lipopolysaccharide transport periplasmic protein LptA [Salinispirillum sp. LH 10-3-1]|uniref:Lipopolysaccharide transport periplasmic protein LptA n=1 Tax=Salinispirillum sp. LH 10-3-1 TaxID=2952525 RepID=A0AB38YCR1_9GAMM
MSKFVRYTALISALAITTLAYALPGDRDLPIDVTADRNQGNLRTNVMTYTGDVVITQGTLTIQAEQVVVYRNDQNEISRMEASGVTPAWVSDQFADGEPFTRLEGELVIYDTETSILTAQGRARLQQGRNVASAHYIRYNQETDDFESSFRAPDGTEGERVSMCLTNENEDGQTADRPAPCQNVR